MCDMKDWVTESPPFSNYQYYEKKLGKSGLYARIHPWETDKGLEYRGFLDAQSIGSWDSLEDATHGINTVLFEIFTEVLDDLS